jgi:hypothetical protein
MGFPTTHLHDIVQITIVEVPFLERFLVVCGLVALGRLEASYFCLPAHFVFVTLSYTKTGGWKPSPLIVLHSDRRPRMRVILPAPPASSLQFER